MSQEKWKVITEYQNHIFDGQYEVSNWGNVRNVKTKKNISFYTDNKGQGYLRFKLYDSEHKRIAIKIHRLVAYYFLDDGNGKTEVDHIDGNVKNNSFSNLRWVSHKENMAYFKESRNKGVKNGNTRNLG